MRRQGNLARLEISLVAALVATTPIATADWPSPGGAWQARHAIAVFSYGRPTPRVAAVGLLHVLAWPAIPVRRPGRPPPCLALSGRRRPPAAATAGNEWCPRAEESNSGGALAKPDRGMSSSSTRHRGHRPPLVHPRLVAARHPLFFSRIGG